MWGKVTRSSSNTTEEGSKEDTIKKLRSSLSSKKEKVDPSELINILSRGNTRKNKVPIVPPPKKEAQNPSQKPFSISIPKSSKDEKNPPPPPEFRKSSLPQKEVIQSTSSAPPDLPPIQQVEQKQEQPSNQLPPKTVIPTLPPKRDRPVESNKEAPQKEKKSQKSQGSIPEKTLMENPFFGPVLEFSPFFEKGEMQNYTLNLTSHKIRFRAKEDSLSSSVLGTALIGRRIPIRMDPMGRISAWFRFAKKKGFYSGQTKMSQIPKGELSLAIVPNELRWVEISVPEQGTTVMTSVGSAIPMLSIMDHLVCWLKLSGGDWSILVNGQKTDYYDILDDFQEQSTYTLTLQRE
jgi:hypothetical protein